MLIVYAITDEHVVWNTRSDYDLTNPKLPTQRCEGVLLVRINIEISILGSHSELGNGERDTESADKDPITHVCQD